MKNFADYLQDDIPKYHKKKRKKCRKSNHKHEYSKEVLLERNTKYGKHYSYALMCNICGKIGKEKYFEFKADDKNPVYRRLLTQKEILGKYKGLPIFKIKN
jgi:hypothetical protein